LPWRRSARDGGWIKRLRIGGGRRWVCRLLRIAGRRSIPRLLRIRRRLKRIAGRRAISWHRRWIRLGRVSLRRSIVLRGVRRWILPIGRGIAARRILRIIPVRRLVAHATPFRCSSLAHAAHSAAERATLLSIAWVKRACSNRGNGVCGRSEIVHIEQRLRAVGRITDDWRPRVYTCRMYR